MNFKNCTLNFLDEQFNLEQIDQSTPLTHWLNQPITIPEHKKAMIKYNQKVLSYNVLSWNEVELVANFIAPMFSLVNFTNQKFNYFMERTIRGTVEGIELNGKPDGMVAIGRRAPKAPYFCFQEYKRESDPDGDPVGQVLAAMLVAQAIHRENGKPWNKPIYGCYVSGKMWHFMVLTNKQYAISNGHNALTDEVFDIFRILLALKEIVISYVAENSK